ncbi:hypothetical protein [Haloglomus halophilum]|uniref:hypothetical protein n=1 Tax=Haloglomus halophilum TaxID=2962672 RepID=UPI0020CA24B5|nr:hypothetical protein [Haloglomus halophilum]
MTRPDESAPSGSTLGEGDADGAEDGTLARYAGVVATAVLGGCSFVADRAAPLDRESVDAEDGQLSNRMGRPGGASPTPSETATETTSPTPTSTASPTRTASPEPTDTQVSPDGWDDHTTPEPADESPTPTETARPAPKTDATYGGAGGGSGGGSTGGSDGGSGGGAGASGGSSGTGGGSAAVAPTTSTPRSTTTETTTSTSTPTSTPTGSPTPTARTPFETVSESPSESLTGTVAVSDRETGYLCQVDTGAAVSIAFAGEAVDGGSVNWYLGDASALASYWDGSEESLSASFHEWSAFDFGPFTTGGGATALLVEPVDDPVTLSYAITVR